MSRQVSSAASYSRARPMELADLRLGGFVGRSVVVLGFARSGIALARFLVDQGARVTVYDVRPEEELRSALAALEGRPVRLLCGPDIDPQEALTDQQLVCTSPSVSSTFSTTEPRLRSALGRVEAEGRIPVVSEVDLFLRLCPAVTIGVTGTKGKTTTSALIAAILERSDRPVVLGGNIGSPLVERLPGLRPQHRVVIELSELQLPTLSRGTDVAVYTHVTSDHLDRHGSVERYRAVKQRLAGLVDDHGALVLNAEDAVSSGYGRLAPASTTVIRYRRSPPPAGGVGVRDGWIVDEQQRIMPVDESPLPGAHNVSNVLAAIAASSYLGVPADVIRAAVAAFRGVEHRLEYVAEIDGVRFINDSMGTQPDAVIAALRSYPAPLILIAGGRAKELAIDELAVVVAQRAAAAVLLGESGPQLERSFRAAGLATAELAGSLEAAVERAHALSERLLRQGAPRPATVLLSPAAASFDMFTDYAARGDEFKRAVASLAARTTERSQA
ncbi:MAG: UDP-N-acetylmuramoyl-L-alanine--D-glutamate ligase [Candidatus Limnocylindrales bacterium]